MCSSGCERWYSRREDRVDTALSEALAPVLHDLGICGAPLPEVRDNQWSDFPGQVTAMLHDVDGTAQGVFVMAAESLPERMASVADQVQEWAVEALWRAGRSASWPECPEHPSSHPLKPAVQRARGVWICPKTRHLVSDIGRLGAPAG
jgi:hypothetical protein